MRVLPTVTLAENTSLKGQQETMHIQGLMMGLNILPLIHELSRYLRSEIGLVFKAEQ